MFTSGCESTPVRGSHFSLAKMACSRTLLRDVKVPRPGEVSVRHPGCPLLRRGNVFSSDTLPEIAGNSSTAVGQARASAWGRDAVQQGLVGGCKRAASRHGWKVSVGWNVVARRKGEWGKRACAGRSEKSTLPLLKIGRFCADRRSRRRRRGTPDAG